MSSEQATSLTLLQRLRDSDQDAWARVTRLYAPLVYHWCARLGVRPEQADDLAQEVFLAAFSCLEQFRREQAGDTFRGWLRGITRNVVLMHFRREGGRARAAGGTEAFTRLEELAEPDLEAGADTPEQLRDLYHRALELIRSDFEGQTWEMFWLAVVEDRPTAEVADKFNVTPNAVRKAKSRVLARLRAELGDLID